MSCAIDSGSLLADFDTCPQCGTEFKPGRLACPECGSDAQTGWQSSEEIDYQSIDLPDEDETPARRGPTSPGMFYLAAILAILAMLVFLLVR